jgi:ATPase subunit of ABC transporter with duplicated ATPase domains
MIGTPVLSVLSCVLVATSGTFVTSPSLAPKASLVSFTATTTTTSFFSKVTSLCSSPFPSVESVPSSTTTTRRPSSNERSDVDAVDENSDVGTPKNKRKTTTSTASTTQRRRDAGGGGKSNKNDVDADDARGAALLLQGVSVWRGPSQILRDLNWRIEPRSKWGLVGSNGSGKSTCLQSIVGDLSPSEGRIAIGVRGGKASIGYLRQTAVAGSRKTVFDEATSGMIELQRAKMELDEALANPDADGTRIDRAYSRFESLGGYQMEGRVAAVLRGLGFNDPKSRRCDELSGGWQVRVALARLLLSEPSICLLDEPGNHLDAAAKRWLAGYLAEYDGPGALVLVTHDPSLLRSVQHIAELVPGGPAAGGGSALHTYKSCTYQQYLDLKKSRAEAAQVEYEKNVEKVAKLQAFVDRFGASATKASAAQSRVKQIEKMRDQGLLDKPSTSIVAARFRPSLILAEPPSSMGDALVCFEGAHVGHGNATLISDVNLEITKGMRLLVRGPNGAGKSTILHALRGTLPILKGNRHENPQLRLGMFTQDLALELDPDARAVDVVTEYARSGPDGDIAVSSEQARGALGRLGLSGDKASRQVRDLSGGERARVCLAMFALKPSNLYLLDEPSNHLDVECVECLSEALGSWDTSKGNGPRSGALVVVSHDRHFCQQLDFTHVATVQNGRLILEQRNSVESDWMVDGMSDGSAPLSTSLEKSGCSDESSKNGVIGESSTDAKRRKQAYNAPKRIAKIEELIASLEDIIASIDADMLANGSDVGKLVDLSKEKEKLETQVSAYMDEWEQLEELLSSFAVS